MHSLYFPLLVAFSTFLSLAHSQCYHPNGTATADVTHQPCSNSSSDPLSAICCAIGRSNPPGSNNPDGNTPTADECLPNGICQNRWTISGGLVTSYWREECTESDWKAGKCLEVCTAGDGADGNVQMTPCDGTATSLKWCCGASDACCDAGSAVIVAKEFGAEVASTSSSAESTSTATSTPTSTSPPTSSSTPSPTSQPTNSTPSPSSSTPPSPSPTPLSAGAKAGIAMGALAGVALIFSAGYLIARRKPLFASKPKSAPAYEKQNESDAFYTPEGKDATAYRLAAAEVQELSGEGRRVEAPSEVRWKSQELP